MNLTIQPITLGWILAIIVLVLVAILLIFGVPDPKIPLVLIAALAVARLI